MSQPANGAPVQPYSAGSYGAPSSAPDPYRFDAPATQPYVAPPAPVPAGRPGGTKRLPTRAIVAGVVVLLVLAIGGAVLAFRAVTAAPEATQEIPLNTPIDGTIPLNGSWVVSFQVDTAGGYMVDALAESDSVLRLYSDSGRIATADDNSPFGFGNPMVLMYLEPGTYVAELKLGEYASESAEAKVRAVMATNTIETGINAISSGGDGYWLGVALFDDARSASVSVLLDYLPDNEQILTVGSQGGTGGEDGVMGLEAQDTEWVVVLVTDRWNSGPWSGELTLS